VDDVLDLEDFAPDIDGDLLRQVAGGDGGCHLRDVANLAGQVAGHRVDGVREVFPGTRDAFHFRLTAEATLGADFPRDARHFGGEGTKLIDHCVNGVFQLQDFAFHIDGDLLGEVAIGDGGGDFGDVAHLAGQVARHEVDAIGQILPRAGDTFHFR